MYISKLYKRLQIDTSMYYLRSESFCMTKGGQLSDGIMPIGASSLSGRKDLSYDELRCTLALQPKVFAGYFRVGKQKMG